MAPTHEHHLGDGFAELLDRRRGHERDRSGALIVI
jgi:hypothetical protein